MSWIHRLSKLFSKKQSDVPAGAAVTSPYSLDDIQRDRGDLPPGFIGLIRAAQEDSDVRQMLYQVLELGEDERRETLHRLIKDLEERGAPSEFIQAVIGYQ